MEERSAPASSMKTRTSVSDFLMIVVVGAFALCQCFSIIMSAKSVGSTGQKIGEAWKSADVREERWANERGRLESKLMALSDLRALQSFSMSEGPQQASAPTKERLRATMRRLEKRLAHDVESQFDWEGESAPELEDDISHEEVPI
jgi:hypothetical protein